MSRTDDPESNLWRRIRVWTDAMPWLALGRCLRPATSLTLLGLTAAAFWLAHAGTRLIGDDRRQAMPAWTMVDRVAALDRLPGDDARALADARTGGIAGRWAERAWGSAPDLFDAARTVAAPALLLSETSLSGRELLRGMAAQLWLLVVWAVPAGLILRQGILAVALRRPMDSLVGLLLAIRRLPALLLAALLPIAAATAAGCFFLIPGWLWRIPTVGPWLAEAVAVLAIPLAIAAGLLAFVSLLAVPLAWAAVMSEPQGDAFDAISRGYEYALRRPLQLAFYLLLAWLISRIAGTLATGIAMAGWTIAQRFLSLAADDPDPLRVAPALLASLPEVFAVVLFWTLVGGIYLLLRRDANSQEVEDLWEPPAAPPQRIPPLPA